MATQSGATGQPPTVPVPSARRLWEAIPRHHREAMEEIARVARAAGWPVYLVGGAVRDLLREAPLAADFDLVIVGDAISVAQTVARAWAAPVATSLFRTARLERQGTVFDLVSARRERYPRPGALPEIALASIEDDLRRRDFSIHALAFAIPPPQDGGLIDPCGGVHDLERGLLRVLHEGSFSDDPTRILRAVRFELRLGFRLDEASERLAKQALKADALDTLSSDRLREEVELAAAEITDLTALLVRWADLGAWRWLAGDLPAPAALARLAAWRPASSLRDAQAVWLALASVLEPAATLRLVRSLGLPPGRAAQVLGARAQLAELETALRRGGAASELADAWLGASTVAREFADGSSDPAVRSGAARAAAAAAIGLRIDGNALVARGASPGVSLGGALRATLAARRDGRLREDQELDFALTWLAQRRAD